MQINISVVLTSFPFHPAPQVSLRAALEAPRHLYMNHASRTYIRAVQESNT
jgi:hypothetical protein